MAGLILLPLAGCGGAIDGLKANYAAKTGNDFYKAGDYLKAIEWYRYGTFLNPDLGIAYYHTALSYMALYKPGSKHPKDVRYADQAIRNLLHYIELNPNAEDPKNYLLNIYLQAERSPMPELRLVVLALQDRLAYAPTFDGAMAALFGEGTSTTSASSGQPASVARTEPTTPSTAGRGAPADMNALISGAAQDLSDYQRLTAEGKLAEAGRKLEDLKRKLEQLAPQKR